MNCQQAKTEIALWVGRDVSDTEQCEAIKRHVAGCPTCRNHYRRMKSALLTLEQAEQTPTTYTTSGSLWPAVSRRIKQPLEPSASPAPWFHGWMPLVAMSAACLVLVISLGQQEEPTVQYGPPVANGPHIEQIPFAGYSPGTTLHPPGGSSAVPVEDERERNRLEKLKAAREELLNNGTL